MINLYTVKLNNANSYDYVQDTLPTEDGVWLCTLTAGLYTQGYTYQVTSGTATRIELAEDLKIEDSIYSTLENVCNYLNNWFYIERQTQDKYFWSNRFEKDYCPLDRQQAEINDYVSDSAYYTFDGTAKTIADIAEDIFLAGDYIRVNYAIRNNFMASVVSKTATELTIDNDEIRTTQENATIFFCDIPKAVEQVVSAMIAYDVFNREVSDLDSENIGNYSYTKSKDFVSIGSLDYPSSMISTLIQYQKLNFIA